MRSPVTKLRQMVLFAGDVLCLLLGLYVTLAIRYGMPVPSQQLEIHKTPFAIIFITWLAVFFIGGLYSLKKSKNNRNFFSFFFSLFGINAAIAVLFFYFIHYFSITPKFVLFLDLGITLVLLIVWRMIYNGFVSMPPLKVAVLGDGPEVQELISDMELHPQQGYKCALHLKDSESYGSLKNLFRDNGIDVVVIAIDYRDSKELQRSLFECITLQIRFYDFVDFYEQQMQKIPLAVIDRAWFLENINEPGKQFFSVVKRTMDILISLILGVVGLLLSPFIIAASLINVGRPIIFSQARVGRFGKHFKILKFRTMKRENEDASVTAVGRFLRSTHLDEIPQLWNIIKGEMSFVGPRPEQVRLIKELQEQIPFYSERLLVQPGITGWAQMHEPRAKASDALTKLQYDLFYIKHRSFLFDVEIILKTLRILII